MSRTHKRFGQDATKDEVLDEGEESCVTLDTTTETVGDTGNTRRDTTTVSTQTVLTINGVETEC